MGSDTDPGHREDSETGDLPLTPDVGAGGREVGCCRAVLPVSLCGKLDKLLGGCWQSLWKSEPQPGGRAAGSRAGCWPGARRLLPHRSPAPALSD